MTTVARLTLVSCARGMCVVNLLALADHRKIRDPDGCRVHRCGESGQGQERCLPWGGLKRTEEDLTGELNTAHVGLAVGTRVDSPEKRGAATR